MDNPNVVFCLQSCGEETLEECLTAFYAGPRITLHEIHNVSPASVALNRMVELCEGSTYFVPLDADMVLYAGFYDRIVAAIAAARGPWHTILFPLWDTLTREKIMALKVFKYGVVKDFRFADTPCPDIRHYRDLTAAGYTTVDLMHEEPIGDHVVRGNYSCYAKYRDLYSVTQAYPGAILESHFKGGKTLKGRANRHLSFFLERYEETGDENYLYCIAGMVEGLTMPCAGSKDLGDREMRVSVRDGKRLFRRWSGRRMM